MNRLFANRPVQYAPLVPFFTAALCGILANAWFTPGEAFWRTFLLTSVFALILTKTLLFLFKRVRIVRKMRLAVATKLLPLEQWLAYSFISGSVWIWLAATALAGLRHEYYYNHFPNDEIGLHIPEGGVSSCVELRVVKTPIFFEYDDNKRSVFGDDSATLFTGQVLRAKNAGVWEDFSGKVAVSVNGPALDLRIGDIVRASGRLSLPARQSNPDDRDKTLYYRAQRILTVFRVNSTENIEKIGTEMSSWRLRILQTLEKTRLAAAGVVREHLSERNAAVAAGMTLGFRNDVDNVTNEKFRRTGTVHLLAISGLHVMLVIGAIALILRILGVSYEGVCLVTIVFVFIYLGLTDMRPPVIRASVLITTMSLGALIYRQGFLLNSLACAALILLAMNPCELFQPGAQLSFLATGTFLWSDPLRRSLASERRREERQKRHMKSGSPKSRTFWGLTILPLWRRFSHYSWSKVCAVTATGALIWAVGAPLILSISNMFTPIAIVANPLVWLPATFSLLLSFGLEFVGLLANLDVLPTLFNALLAAMAYATDKSFDFFLWILDMLSSTKAGVFYLPSPSTLALWSFYGPLVFLTLFPHFQPKRRYVLAFVLVWVVAVSSVWGLGVQSRRSKDFLDVDVFSVGHGCAVLGRFSDGRTFLYDCGSLENSQRAAEIVAKNLWNSGKTSIDLVVLSHADFDHYGGIETLAEFINIKSVCVSPVMFKKKTEALASLREELDGRGVAIVEASGGDALDELGFAELTFLHPTRDENSETSPESNSNSVVLAVEFCDRIILLTGDLDNSDAAFLETPPLKCDFVLAPHHGGHSASADRLYEWSDPTYVGVSGGSFLRNYATEDALREQGRLVAHTFDDGDIQIRVERDPARPEGQGFFYVSTFKTKRSSLDGAF